MTTKHGWIAVLAATFLMQVINAYLYFLCPILAPAVLASSGQSAWFIGWLGAASTLGSILFMLWGNPLVLYWGPLRSLQIGTLIGGASVFLLLTPGPVGVSVANFLMGLGYGPSAPAGSDILHRFAPQAHRNLIFSIRQAGVPLSGMLAGLVLPLLYAAGGWTVVVGTTIVLSLLAVLVVNPVRRLTDMQAMTSSPAPTVLSSSLAMPFRMLAANRLLLLACAGSCLAIGHGCWIAYFVTWLTTDRHLSLPEAGVLFAIMQGASVVGRLALGWLADHSMSDLLTLGLAVVGSALMSLVLAWAPIPDAFPAMVLVAIAAGVAVSSWNGVQLAAIARRARPEDIAVCASGATIIMFLGFVFGPAGFAVLLLMTTNLALCFAIIGSITLLGVVFILVTYAGDQSRT